MFGVGRGSHSGKVLPVHACSPSSFKSFLPVTSLFILSLTASGEAPAVSFTPLGGLPGGILFSLAEGVSADGKTIVGSGRNPSGQAEGFVAVIPEPSTALLMGLGLVGLGMMRSRVGAWHRDSPQTI